MSNLTESTAARRHISFDRLPSLSTTVMDALRIANDLNASATALEKVIVRDIALTAQILKVANSSFFGLRRTVESVREAIVLLGTRRVRGVASLQAIAPVFASHTEGVISGRQLWSHGLAVAIWSQKIGARVGFPNLEHVFTAGLMHDVGIIVMHSCVGKEYEDVVALARDTGRPLQEMETEKLGIHHSRLGAMVCAKWMLSPRLTHLISTHHDAGIPDTLEAQILKLADWLAGAMGQGEFPWTKREPLPTELCVILGIHPAEIDEILADSVLVQDQIDGLFTH